MLNVPLDANYIGRQNHNKIFEPQRQNNAVIFLPNLYQKLKDGGFDDANAEAEAVFAMSIDTFPTPKWSNNIIEVPYNNMRIKVAGAMVFDDMDIGLKDFIDVQTSALLAQWRLLVSNPANGAVNLAYKYKVDGCLVKLYGPDGSHNRYFQVDGVWLSRLDCGEVDHSADDYIRMVATLTCDRIIPLLALGNDGTRMPTVGAGKDMYVSGSIPLG